MMTTYLMMIGAYQTSQASTWQRKRIWVLSMSILDEKEFARNRTKVGIWQGLADIDPDVDAIYRLIINKPCTFWDREPIVLGKGTLCPINSQNTAFAKDLFPLLYLPCFVTFRFTDILRGLVAQPILWAKGYRVGFSKASVYQKRNAHDHIKDFESEIPCYLHSEKVVEIVSKVVDEEMSVADNLLKSYEALSRNGIVTKKEICVVKGWLADLAIE